MDLEKDVADFIKSNELIDEQETIVVGVSGGPDSVALLHILYNLNLTHKLNCNIHIAHLNHKLRDKESDQDAEFVNQLAKKLNLPLLTKETNITKTAKTLHLSIEETARIERYKFFESYANETGATKVVLAHSADDNAETILQRIIRGTGILGLCGIKLKRSISPDSHITVIRPLLNTWKTEIIWYLKENEFLYRTDSSNLGKEYNRNKIRLELIPLIEKSYNNKFKQGLINLSEICNDNNNLIHNLSQSLFKDAIVEQNENRYIFDCKILSQSTAIVLQRFVNDVFTKMNVPLKHIGHTKYRMITDLIKSSKRHDEFKLSDNLKVLKTETNEGELYFYVSTENVEFKTDKNCDYKNLTEKFGEIPLTVPGITELPLINSKIEAKVIENSNGFLKKFKVSKTNNEETFDMANIEMPLYVRLRKPGDTFRPIGLKGTKKIKEFLIDNKIPSPQRHKLPIVMSKHHPAWIVGLRIDERVKVTEETEKILILKHIDLKNEQYL